MRSLITGAAGFVGSHLAEKLLLLGHEVTGIDKFLDNYPQPYKKRNLAALRADAKFAFVEGDILRLDLRGLIRGVDYLFHLAGQPGVRASWGKEFSRYTENNVTATQMLLEAAKGTPLKKFVYASTSSVYGDTADLPMREEGLTRPVSPYGVSKLAAEHLCYLYSKAFAVPTIALRFFTVYGPRQRPDMFFHVLMRGLLRDEETPLYDDGEQTRDFTFVSDIVEGMVSASQYSANGEVFNLGGGAQTSLLNAVSLAERVAGRTARLKRFDRQKGDVRHTSANLAAARAKLAYVPQVGLEEGLSHQWIWIQSLGY